jgi:hypothetical protein
VAIQGVQNAVAMQGVTLTHRVHDAASYSTRCPEYFICLLENIHTRTLCMFGNVYFTLTLQAGRQAGRLYIILLFYIHTLHFLYTHSVFVW